MNLWIDDIRLPPDDSWRWAKNYRVAIMHLTCCQFDEVSFDHDLGEGKTGYDIAKWIEEQAYYKKLPKMRWKVHSANTVGANNIRDAMTKADVYWNS